MAYNYNRTSRLFGNLGSNITPRRAVTLDDYTAGAGFTGTLERHTYPKLFNLYLDPKEQHNYLTRKLAYVEAFQLGMRRHLASFKRFPGKQVMGLGAAEPRAAS